MSLVDGFLYVANTDGVVRFPYVDGATRIDAPAQPVAALPAGPINHHWTKNIVASRDGTKLYASVGSNSNVAERGRAEIREIDLASGASRTYASGLRNPNGMDFEPETGALWTVGRHLAGFARVTGAGGVLHPTRPATPTNRASRAGSLRNATLAPS